MRRWLGIVTTSVLAACAAPVVEEPAVAPESIAFAPQLAVDVSQMQRLEGGLLIRDMRPGDGPVARRGDNVAVRYVGWLPDGTTIDAVVTPAAPKPFRLGSGQVIRGWDQAVVGMRVGGQRQVVIPPSLGYGRRQVGGIPPGSTLVFLIELVSAR